MESWGFFILLLLAFVAAQIYGYLRRAHLHANRINDYFCNAVMVYAWLGDQDAKLAALAAAKVAAGKQRASMLEYLNGMAADLVQYMPLSGTSEQLGARLRELEREIKAKDWDLADIREEKGRLLNRNPEYLTALDKADPDVFIRRHPDLFKALT